MNLNSQTPQKTLKAFLKQRLLRSEMDKFKSNLKQLLDEIKAPHNNKTEEHLKAYLRDFLLLTYYTKTNAINTHENQDLVIHLGKTTAEKVGVIIETKRPSNASEMISKDSPNKKALHELILYYLNEREAGNYELKHLIVTSINEWYIFDANYFDKFIYGNGEILNLYKTKVNDKKANPLFYQEIKRILEKVDFDIPCTYFKLTDYEAIVESESKENDKELSALYKMLSPQHLLKIATPNDSNALNEKFYKELLHILGLEDAKEEGKNIIRRKKENRNAASLIEITIDSLKLEDVLHRISDLSIYGNNETEIVFNISLELCITWINRILFLKLLEGQLSSYHPDNQEDYTFLNTKTIPDFCELFRLFHKVLAVNVSERSASVNEKYGKIPYLNSSLFEITELEYQTIKINSLDNASKLELMGASILNAKNTKTTALPTLEYLFQFLGKYDFSSEGTSDIQEDNKTLINASVLGKVFEKINGYKDGSIFTPAFITMYMCRESIRKAVVEKFNSVLSAEGKVLFPTFQDVKNYCVTRFSTKDILEANKIVNSIRICDPAVGSGHFLVSALNEMICIKSELQILADKDGNSISGYEMEIVNDELIITNPRDRDNSLEYKIIKGKPLTKEIQHLQKTLFHEKQNLIENCLFGVDINPNSVKICRLRLWIELLKNAYYKEEKNYLELETLPNIDINIKCGNSLLSRFELEEDLSKIFESIGYSMEKYRTSVNEYKNEKNRDKKTNLQKEIDAIKAGFRTEIGKKDPKKIRLNELNLELRNLLNQGGLFELSAKQQETQKEKQAKLEAEIRKLTQEIEDIKQNVVYKKSFEWRFEFPEVLDKEGKFLGFDLIIGNPPYGVKINRNTTPEYSTHYEEILEGELETYILFYFKGLSLRNENGFLAYITPDGWLTNKAASKFRDWLQEYFDFVDIFDFYKPFTEAKDTRCHSLLIGKLNTQEKIQVRQVLPANPNIIYKDYQVEQSILKSFEGNEWRLYVSAEARAIFAKMESISKPLESLFKVKYGLRTGDNKKYVTLNETPYPVVAGADIASLYEIKWIPKYLQKTEELPQGYFKEFYTEQKIIVQRIRTNSLNLNARWIEAAYIEGNYIPNDSLTYIYAKSENMSILYVLAILNSFLMNKYYRAYYTDVNVKPTYLAQLPIPEISQEAQQPFIDLVNKIIDAKQKGEESRSFEVQLDEKVYNLYGVSEAEKELI
jgi:adenine-specific DNA-methyltransferase